MKKFFLLGCTWMLCLLAGCANDAFESETSVKNGGEPFTLYAKSSSGADTRLAFGENGLDLSWEDGDQLVLIDVEGQLDPIFLTTQLEAPATEAVFRSTEAVPSGRYFIRNVGSTLYSKEGWMQFGTSNFKWNTHKIDHPLRTLNEWNSSQAKGLKDFMYAPVIDVAEGQFSGSVEFKHAYAMLKLDITGTESLTPAQYSVGMLCPTKAFPVFIQMNEDGEESQIVEQSPKILLGNGIKQDELSSTFSLILPANMNGQKIYMYISDDNGVAYEIVKDGKDFKAGVCYTVKIDLKQAERIDVSDKQLSTPKDFRALACSYYNSNTYTITNDIDFTNEEYFPISLGEYDGTIEGNGHTLKNLNINWPFKNAGLIDCAHSTKIKNLTLENVTVIGTDYVGAFCGDNTNGTNISNCKLLGNNTITGTGNYVGGIIGGSTSYRTLTLSSCEVSSNTTVTGQDYVGGIAGLAWNISESKSAAQVSGANYIGGIAGEIEGTASESGSSATITATGDEAGGICGRGGATKCFFTGSVKGNNNVGGIIGNSYNKNINLCFSTGDIEGNSYVGGIVGCSNGWSSSDIFNSYSLSKIAGTDKTAGILGGDINSSRVQKCYFAGTLNGGNNYGISSSARVSNCITTASKLGSNDSETDAAYVNLTSIQSQLSHINGDRVYSEETVWKDYEHNCPLLLWQIPTTDTGGVTPPPFTEEEW